MNDICMKLAFMLQVVLVDILVQNAGCLEAIPKPSVERNMSGSGGACPGSTHVDQAARMSLSS